MKHLYMVDIETTGTSLEKDQILQLSIVQMIQDKGPLWDVGEVLNIYFYTDVQPEQMSTYAKKHQCALYDRCRSSPYAPFRSDAHRKVVVQMLNGFIERCHGGMDDLSVARSLLPFVGWNAAGFDMPFLVRDGLFRRPEMTSEGHLMGTYHYRILDLQSLVSFFMTTRGYTDRESFLSNILSDVEDNTEALRQKHSWTVDGHDGLYDCFRQIRILNGLTSRFRNEVQKEARAHGEEAANKLIKELRELAASAGLVTYNDEPGPDGLFTLLKRAAVLGAKYAGPAPVRA